jgi:imidazolonepropionase-like amidohydrolase
MKMIKNARIITGTGKVYERGCIVFDDKIRFIGDGYTEAVDEEIDVKGATVTPGLIDAHTHIGLFGDSLGFEGADANEDSDPITPHLRAIDGINPQDRMFEEARKAGVTSVVTGPGSANAIGGQFAAIKTAGVCVDDMIIKAPCAMKMALGENPKTVYNEKSQTPMTRMGTLALIRETLYKAKNYKDDLKKYYEDTEENDKPEFDMRLEAMLPVINKEIPVKIHAHRADDICSGIRLAKEFDIDITIEHCSDGDIIADILQRENIAVNLGPTLTDRSKPELKNLSFDTYKNLSGRGLSVAIITDHPEITQDNLPLCAAMAVSRGMDEEQAFNAITINAARNCKIDERVGSLEIGKDADICVFSDNPVKFGAVCQMSFIDGKRVF